jgi:hypothetical protein
MSSAFDRVPVTPFAWVDVKVGMLLLISPPAPCGLCR